MAITVPASLAFIAFILTLVSGCTSPSRVPLWIPLLLVTIALMIPTFVR